MRIVLKIGSNVLIGDKKNSSQAFIKKIANKVHQLQNAGHEVIIISSGAVAVGHSFSKDCMRSTLAAIGQANLMAQYVQKFEKYNITVAQILLSPNSFRERDRYDRLQKTIEELVSRKITPIINENDVTVTGDTFGENDSLAAMVAIISSSDRLIFLTNVDGLYSGDPETDKNAQLISEVNSLDLEKQKLCYQKKSTRGRGGMLSKLKGAKLATTCGVETYIVNGYNLKNISKVMAGISAGTKFIAKTGAVSERKKWLLIGSISQGKIIIDQGARTALENKRSLLAVGVRGITGTFKGGDFVNVSDQQGEIFAFGLVNYNSRDLLPLGSIKDKEAIKKNYKKEIIHIDNLTLLK